MELKLYQIDAFTDTIFEGNPACVVPLDNWLSDDILLKITKENAVVVDAPKAIVVDLPKKANVEDIKRLVEKLNPDQIGTYASLFLTVDTSLANKYQTEFQALGALSNKIVTSFYDDFRPVKTAQNN